MLPNWAKPGSISYMHAWHIYNALSGF